MPQLPWRGALLASAATALAIAITSLPLGAHAVETAAAPSAPCLTLNTPLQVEEQRLGQALPGGGAPAGQRFVEAAGFEGLVQGFFDSLCGAESVAAAQKAARTHGQRLWDTAVARAQGTKKLGTIDRYDDRPLYWARVYMTRALRQWAAPFAVTGTQRNALIRNLDRASRGISSVRWPSARGAKRVMISGFDTYSLDSSLRNSNPSGASALQLDGRTVQTPDGPVTVQAVVIPVNWTDFDQGIVEESFAPVLAKGKNRADLIMTISQTARGRMDIEKWAANARGGSPDNNRNMLFGEVSRPSHWPQPADSPNWIHTTLPYRAMIAAKTGPWPVILNDGICEWPAGTFPDATTPRCQDDPSRGSTAASGPGGNYLSNESMYRSNRLRLGYGLKDFPGGHLHVSALVYPTDQNVLTSSEFEADRKAIVDQTVALVLAAGAAQH
jgi:pyrrolidone-carboxylate peptidase